MPSHRVHTMPPAAWLVLSFTVRSFEWALLGALLVGAVSWFIGSFGRDRPS